MENLKTKTNYNIKTTVLKEFNKLSKEKAINKSALIEIFMSQWIQQNKK